jgi:putative thioredoxin
MMSLRDEAKPGDGLIKESSTAAFRADVMAESMKQPVLVDFWAPWCEPCKQLTPVIEKVVRGAKGRVKLVTLDIDKYPEIPGQLGIQSIPAVIAFQRGQPVDGFMGALPEKDLRGFIERLVGPLGPGAVDEIMAEAKALTDVGDLAGAADLYAAVLVEDPGHAGAIGALAKLHLDLGDSENARRFLAMVPPGKENDPAVAAARAAIDLKDQTASLGDTAELEARLAANPADHQARFDLALALAAANEREKATDALIEIIKRDRTWDDDGARRQLLQFFDVWGPMDEMTVAGRRKLSAVLFR